MKKQIHWIAFILVVVLIACDDRSWVEPDPYVLAPVIQTSDVKYVTQYTATCGGVITAGGGGDGIIAGICWSTKPHPRVSVSTDPNPSSDNMNTFQLIDTITSPVHFECPINELTGNTTYYIRAFAQNLHKGSWGGYYSTEEAVYGDEITFTTDAKTPTVTDIDGNVYHTIQIGTQLWMLENLRTTKYNDSTVIQTVKGEYGEQFDTHSPLYFDFWFNSNNKWYDPLNKLSLGLLYNGYAVMSGKLAPVGWHVPTIEDWTKLSDYLGGDSISGGKLKSAFTGSLANQMGFLYQGYWMKSDIAASNSSGFSALPGGIYYNNGSNTITFDISNPNTFGFNGSGYYGRWWSSTPKSQNQPVYYSIGLTYNRNQTFYYEVNQTSILSVRCIKDE